MNYVQTAVSFFFCVCSLSQIVAQAQAAWAGEAAAARCLVVPTPGRRACRARGARRNLRRDFFNDRRLSAPRFQINRFMTRPTST